MQGSCVLKMQQGTGALPLPLGDRTKNLYEQVNGFVSHDVLTFPQMYALIFPIYTL